jgi:hypothetical protein
MKAISMNRIGLYLFFLLTIILLSSCAQSQPVETCLTREPYGFLGGLRHGFIAPVSFLISLFDDKIAMYAMNNTGGWYDFGFVLGAGILFGGSGKASR